MPVMELADWLVEQSEPGCVWFIKRLSANDTLATQAHQAGPYIDRKFLFKLFPTLDDPKTLNPRINFNAYIDSHADAREVNAIWYNNKLFGSGTRNEARITNWGGRSSALLDPESTGALSVFVFHVTDSQVKLHVWVCNHETEADLIEDYVGPVEPGRHIIWTPDSAEIFKRSLSPTNCYLAKDQLPSEWLARFPTIAEIIEKTKALCKLDDKSCDERLIKRRECEFQLFLSVEEAYEMPRIAQGFTTMQDFVRHAQSVLQRRKSRSGRSLELQTKAIFLEENLIEGQSFQHGVESDSGKRPDFLFPSQSHYRDTHFPENRLRMLAVKTTCKDRWRQILNEAPRIKQKHLLTLQEGVSEAQFAEMEGSGVKLVVPKRLISKYPEPVRPKLMTLHDFINEVRHLSLVE
ncbi:MAG: type II restriction endonuclease [Flavobacteriales bacterium]|nr:type II restriction endonuclease [Flavobacteriales bacterium]